MWCRSRSPRRSEAERSPRRGDRSTLAATDLAPLARFRASSPPNHTTPAAPARSRPRGGFPISAEVPMRPLFPAFILLLAAPAPPPDDAAHAAPILAPSTH